MTEFKLENTRESVEALVEWATAFRGVEANPVYDYIDKGGRMIPGPLNGVTLQWGIGWDLTYVGTSAEDPGDLYRISTEAIHVKVGGTVTRTESGFDVVNPEIKIEAPRRRR